MNFIIECPQPNATAYIIALPLLNFKPYEKNGFATELTGFLRVTPHSHEWTVQSAYSQASPNTGLLLEITQHSSTRCEPMTSQLGANSNPASTKSTLELRTPPHRQQMRGPETPKETQGQNIHQKAGSNYEGIVQQLHALFAANQPESETFLYIEESKFLLESSAHLTHIITPPQERSNSIEVHSSRLPPALLSSARIPVS